MERRDWVKNKLMGDHLYLIIDIRLKSFHLRRAGESNTTLIVPLTALELMFLRTHLKPSPEDFVVGQSAFSTVFGKILITKVLRIDEGIYFIYFNLNMMRLVFDILHHPPVFESYSQFISYWLEEKWIYQ